MPEVAADRSEASPVTTPPVDAGRPSVQDLLADLGQEQRDVERLVAGLDGHGWALPTTPGWSVRDQIAHLAHFDAVATTSILAPGRFAALNQRAMSDLIAYESAYLGAFPAEGDAVLEAWRGAAELFRQAATQADPAVRLQWFGPPMSLLSLITARLMETWAHGQDVADSLAVGRNPTERLRHVASLAYRARGEGYRVRGLAMPKVDVRVELVAPDGSRWSFGPNDAAQVVRGPAEDFCLVLVRRRQVEDTALEWDGAAAGEWLRIGQAYAGPPGAGAPRRPHGGPAVGR